MLKKTRASSRSEPHGLFLGSYRLKETIGTGSFGKVKLGEHIPTGVPVAVKIINREKVKNAKMDQNIRREIANMKRFRHPHIIKLYEVIETPTDVFLILEYVDGGELFDYIVNNGKLSEGEARVFFQQIISAVSYCHAHKVVHRDLKPENLLLDSKNRFVKIADFGLSNIIVDGDFFKTSCGSPNYAAPEVISGKLYTGPEVDVWSCGVILYALLTARLPFDDEYIPLLFEKIREGRYTLPSFLSESCKDLISKMLVVDALQRITIAEIKAHPWFRQDLPKYLENFNENDTFTEFQYIDPRIVAELELKFKLPQSQIIKKLREEEEDGNSNPLIVAYRLLYDSGNYTQEGAFDQTSFIAQSLAEMSMSPSVNLAEDVPFYEEAPVPVQQHLQKQLADNLSHLNQTLSPAPRKPLHSGFINNVVRDMETTTTTTNTKNSEEKEVETLQSTADSLFVSAPPPNKIKNKWYLGILSQKLPKEIMSEVFRVLRLLNFEWKHVGCYQLRCRHVKLCKNGGKELIKLAIQLFTINTKRRHKYVNSHRSSEKKDTNIIYLLDIKRIEGELFAFLELSNRLLTELKL